MPAGATLAIGENGAGKTTLIKLLWVFYEPAHRRITLGGTDLREHEIKMWSSRIAARFQDFARFELVARETVGVGDLLVIEDLQAVEAALVGAGAEDVLPPLPAGRETHLGRAWDSCVELCGGQWQKLALVRALMRERPLLLILAEPTASLDAEAEHELSRPPALWRALCKGRLC